ncbi:MAG: ABC transporter ATP-binding protein [Pseudomonadota bacterium]
MVESGPLIKLAGVSFAYDHGPLVLDSVDFSFYPGDRAGLTGANGSGKTTLSQVIMGLLSPSGGRLEIFGAERKTEKDFREVRAGIGFVFQDADDQLFCPTVAEDVAFGPLNLGATHAEARSRVSETLEILGLAGFEDRVTYKLSGGEKKLVALATVLVMRPQMLLLDEPTAGLDEATNHRIAGVLLESKLPYLIISHDREFLSRTTSKTFLIEKGRVTEISGRV